MNNLIKLSVAGSLALGSLAAHAGIVVPTSSVPGDAILFADIFNGSTLVATYAGDTGVGVTNIVAGTVASGTHFEDANLAAFLAQATPGTVVDWMVGGAGGLNGGSPSYAVTTTGGALAQTIGDPLNAAILVNMSAELQAVVQNGLNPLINEVDPNGTSLLGKDDSSFGISFAPFQTNTDMSNWGGQTGQVATAGLTGSGTGPFGGTSKGSLLYAYTTTNNKPATLATYQQSYDVSLTSSGLTFTAASTAPVPVPAAVWLLGSGLLGLAGIARRKSAAV
jgi:hypothetical protein